MLLYVGPKTSQFEIEKKERKTKERIIRFKYRGAFSVSGNVSGERTFLHYITIIICYSQRS